MCSLGASDEDRSSHIVQLRSFSTFSSLSRGFSPICHAACAIAAKDQAGRQITPSLTTKAMHKLERRCELTRSQRSWRVRSAVRCSCAVELPIGCRSSIQRPPLLTSHLASFRDGHEQRAGSKKYGHFTSCESPSTHAGQSTTSRSC